MSCELVQYSHGLTRLASVQNLFQDFVAGLNMEEQNSFFLLYLAQTFIDDSLLLLSLKMHQYMCTALVYVYR